MDERHKVAVGSTLHSDEASAASANQATAIAATRSEGSTGRSRTPDRFHAASAAPATAAAARNGHTARSSQRPVRSSTLLENSSTGPLVNTSRAADAIATLKVRAPNARFLTACQPV